MYRAVVPPYLSSIELWEGLWEGPDLSGLIPTVTVFLDLLRMVRLVTWAGDTMVGTLMGRCREAVGTAGMKEPGVSECVSRNENIVRHTCFATNHFD